MTRPNVVLVLADQLRRQALGCYGDPNVHTPHIDALAAAGTRFDAACATYPLCVPFRFSLQTGEYPHTRAIPSIQWRMSPAERTLADEFHDAGYATAWFGKWHLYGLSGQAPGHTVVKASRTPVPRSFQGRWGHFAGFELCNDPYDTYYSVNGDPTMHRLESFQTDGLFDLGIEWLTSRRAGDRPVCMVLSVEPPHPLFTAPPEYRRRWQRRDLVLRDNVELDRDYRSRGPHGTGLLDDLRLYYAMIENLDDNLGRLIAALGQVGLAGDTVVVVTSDHGELLGCHGMQAKQWPWEESVGIPLIISGSPLGSGATVVDDPVNTEDLFPTLLGLAGLSPRHAVPGLDLSPLVRGERDRLDREGVLLEFVAEFRPFMPFHEETWRGLRTRGHTYTVLGDAHGGRPWQFFDLTADPYQRHNLVDAPGAAEQVRHHHALLRARLVATRDHYVLAPAHGCDGLNEWDPRARFQDRFG